MSAIQLYSMEIRVSEAWFILSAQTKEKLKEAFHVLNPGISFDEKLIEKTKIQKRQ
tara:strand:+ start:292 stop:459 length:168 start_codon:yes stop_codon:yes gene_type:complete